MVYTLGESLLDIIFENQQNAIAKAGGGMLNTSVSLGRSGVEVSLISELGDDKTAQIIFSFLEKNNVSTKSVNKYFQQNSSVAIAHLDEQKVASFSIYKSYPAIRSLIIPSSFSEKDFLVFGSLYSLDPEIRNDVKTILASAKSAGTIICYDPNIRSHDLSKPEIRTALLENIAFAEIVKASDQDMETIFGQMTPQEYYSEIKNINPTVIFILTLGSKGVVGFKNDFTIELPAKEINLISTIGAGDAFNAGIIFYLFKNGYKANNLSEQSKESFNKMLETATSFSAEVCETLENYVSEGFTR